MARKIRMMSGSGIRMYGLAAEVTKMIATNLTNSCSKWQCHWGVMKIIKLFDGVLILKPGG
jgi:hypothetical protein